MSKNTALVKSSNEKSSVWTLLPVIAFRNLPKKSTYRRDLKFYPPNSLVKSINLNKFPPLSETVIEVICSDFKESRKLLSSLHILVDKESPLAP